MNDVARQILLEMNKALADIAGGAMMPVPDHLKDAHYKGAQRLGRGQG